MTDEFFDPYSSWLGVRTKNRPPNHYELLGLENFESDTSVISNAIDKQASILQMVTGDQMDVAKKLLRDVGQVRNCLLDEKKRTQYDQSLRNELTVDELTVDGLPKIVTGDVNAEAEKPGSPPPLPNQRSQAQLNPGAKDVGGPPHLPNEKSQARSNADMPGLVPDLNADLQHRRIESQRAKEETDQKVKVVLDKVMWASCGICFVAIVWVMIAKTSCRSNDPVIIEDGDPDKLPTINTRKISPQKKLNSRIVSPLENQSKKAMENTRDIGNANKLLAGANKGTGQPGLHVFKPVDQTIGFFHFNEPVNESDLLDGLASIQLSGIKWEKRGKDGFISLSDDSQIYIGREKAFDTIKELTLLCKFKTGQRGAELMYLFSLKKLLLVAIEKGSIRIGGNGQLDSVKYGSSLDNQRWHELAVVLGTSKSSIRIDGVSTAIDLKIPEFKKSGKTSNVGSTEGDSPFRFIGSIDNLGFYWIALSEDQIRNQFAK